FNPDWTLPPTVIRKDLIPKGRRMARAKQSVLTRYGIDAYTSHGGRKLDPKRVNWSSSSVYNYVYKQEPGPENPLGFVKIDFHNAHAVYIHDTPSKRVFGRADRAASSGCVRVQDISRLVTWMLRGNGNWSAGRVAQMKKSGESLNVSLKRQVPVHFVYMTSWVAPDGSVQFRRDLYGKDRRYGVSRLASQ
ncbi:MAG: L,D-transpeptidase family protein, partial [Pseudomonadota bacterium]